MKKVRNHVAIVALFVFVVVAGYLVWNGRPVVQRQNNTSASASESSESVATNETLSVGGGYTFEEVVAHATKDDCWSAIGGSVYDLTTWASRHPGGENPIIGLCGTDGTERFEKKHGSSKNAQNALILLKIGSLE